MKIIIDVSVAAKWFFKEEDWEKADKYLTFIEQGQVEVVVPDLFFYEIGNVFLIKNMSLDKVKPLAARLKDLNFEMISLGHEFFAQIYQNAKKFSLTFYDCAYITLMQQFQYQFVTADKKLYQKIKKSFPQAKLL